MWEERREEEKGRKGNCCETREREGRERENLFAREGGTLDSYPTGICGLAVRSLEVLRSGQRVCAALLK